MRAIFAEITAPLLRRPLVCLALLWVGGILLAARLAIPTVGWAAVSALFLTAWGLVQRIGCQRISHIALSLSILCLAAAMSVRHFAPPESGDPRYLPTGSVLVCGYSLSPPRVTSDGWRANFRVVGRREGDRWHAARTTIYLFGRENPPVLGRYALVLGSTRTSQPPRDPFSFSWKQFLAERNLDYAMRASAVTPTDRVAPVSRFFALRRLLHERLTALTAGIYGPLHAQLLNALLLGVYDSQVPASLVEHFRRAGTIHLMVVSGSQVALLGGFLLFPLWLTTRGRAGTTYPRLRVLLLLITLPILGLYVILADRGPSIDRAVLMAVLGIIAVFLAVSPFARRRAFQVDGVTLLAAAGLVLLVARPSLLFSPALQLSFAASFGLFTITPVLMRITRRLPSMLTLGPAATLGAQLMTYPVLAWHFGTLPLLAPLTNLVAVPVVTVLLPIGLFTLLFSVLAPPLATLLNAVNAPLVSLLLSTSVLASKCPWAELHWTLRSPGQMALYFIVLTIGIIALSRWADRIGRDWVIPAGREPRMW